MFKLCEIFNKLIYRMNSQFSEKKILNIFALFYSLLIVIFSSSGITILDDPFYTDEIGYWAAGAWFSGIDWSSVMSKSAYFGWGYGIFLAPFFMLEDSVKMFHSAVLINALFLVGTFLCVYNILCKLFCEKSKKLLMFVSFSACMYTYNIVYAHITMSEVCLTFFFSLMIFQLCKFCEKPSICNNMLWYLSLVILVVIHLRTLIFIIVAIVPIVWMLFKRKLNWKKILCSLIFLFIILIGVFLIKDYIVEILYTDNALGVHNEANDNVGDKLSMLKGILSLDWWKNLCGSVAGKIFYLSVSSFFVFPLAIWGLGKHLWINRMSRNAGVYIFLVCGILCNLGFISLLTMNPERVDQVLYGRYIENTLPVYLAVGLLYIFEQKKDIKYILLISIACNCLFSQVVYKTIYEKDLDTTSTAMLPLQTSGIAGFPNFKAISAEIKFAYYILLIAIIISVLWICVLNRYKYIAIIIIVSCWILTAQTGMNNYLYNLNETKDIKQYSRIARFSSIKEFADYIEESNYYDVYYLFENDNHTSAYFDMFSLQFDLVACEMKTVNNEDFQFIDENDLLIVHKFNSMYEEVQGQYNLMFENSYFGLFCK